ncbi:hypothetical protein VCRA2126O85_30069 [Vibrio crassostreae]|nr:hypothetical protein VCRA2128O106_20067 [Vibrio crassostreae]CAK2833264.1 hypothetical protein VCRA2128O100_20184 [Vibrio crassostreae]CAK2842512.1 hypothetical protein VCRA2126O84_20192 [Vibrio crassostreae]CAK2925498.1 hypothetical protein VCRA2126O85_30069 [Vibrio crassostreae]CAK2925847.1 hypothetical protein VCRA2125O83_30068 [Vibrio crassostreae]
MIHRLAFLMAMSILNIEVSKFNFDFAFGGFLKGRKSTSHRGNVVITGGG